MNKLQDIKEGKKVTSKRAMGIATGASLAVVATTVFRWQKEQWAISAVAALLCVVLYPIFTNRTKSQSLARQLLFATLIPYLLWSLTYFLFTAMYLERQGELNKTFPLITVLIISIYYPFIACYGYVCALGAILGVVWERYSRKTK
jgi:hypothetical protein